MDRLQIQTVLEEVLGSGNVYFQPPASLQMVYPCVVYALDYASTDYANNDPYRYNKRYQVTYIDRDPDSAVPDRLARLRMSRFKATYASNNLNHTVFTIFF